MDRIVSFEDFSKKSGEITEENHIESTEQTNEGGDRQYYMFFQNLASIKHYIDEISKMSPDDVIVKRRGVVFVINKKKPRHKQRQG